MMAGISSQEHLWIYTSHIGHYASIHRAECGFCNSGSGLGAGRNEYHGGWRGPFPSVDEAVQQVLMNRETLKEMRYCQRCL